MSIQAAITALKTVLGDRLTCVKADLDEHGKSESHFPMTPPDAVAYPSCTADVELIVQTCARHQCPVIGWGAGTSLEGHGLAIHGGIVVDFRDMNQVLAINADDMDVRVQPGVSREALNDALRHHGLFFPVDPGANATIGGMASTRASGTTAVRYGTMRDNVMGLEVVTADGQTIRTGTRARKSAAGYDLTALFVGAEGTLGLITELTLKLQGQPPATAAAVCAFETVDKAVAAVIETIQMGIPMARIELLDTATVRAVNNYAGATFPEQPHLFLEFHGNAAAVEEQAQEVGTITQSFGATGFEWETKQERRNRLWKMRHDAAWAIVASRPGARSIITDICVPISNLAQAISETQDEMRASGMNAPILGHVGDGNFHSILLIDPEDPNEIATAKAVSARLANRALALGGTITGEHGIGYGKLTHMRAEHGAAWQVMGALKKALDPDNIMNPGKLVPGN